jgi:hypothetical protein
MNCKTVILWSQLAICAIPVARGADQQFGDWMAGLVTAKTATYAATVNESGSVLGEYCVLQTGKCFWTIVLDLSCSGSDTYPILGNTASGAVQLNIQCDGKTDNGAYRYIVVNWKDLEALLKDSSQVGFAIPMKSELFKVARFSLNGRSDAMTLAETAAASQARGNVNKNESLKANSDTTL